MHCHRALLEIPACGGLLVTKTTIRSLKRKEKRNPALFLFPELCDLQKCGCELFFWITLRLFSTLRGHVPIRHACECVFLLG